MLLNRFPEHYHWSRQLIAPPQTHAIGRVSVAVAGGVKMLLKLFKITTVTQYLHFSEESIQEWIVLIWYIWRLTEINTINTLKICFDLSIRTEWNDQHNEIF